MIVSSSEDAIKRVVEAFERSGWAEIDVRSGNLRVHLVDLGTGHAAERDRPRRSHGGCSIGARRSRRRSETSRNQRHLRPCRWTRRPDPTSSCRRRRASSGARPSRGYPRLPTSATIVDASATVCIIEVMKLMNHVKAGVSGEVVAVYGENGVAVKKGQALFAIAPPGPSS